MGGKMNKKEYLLYQECAGKCKQCLNDGSCELKKKLDQMRTKREAKNGK